MPNRTYALEWLELAFRNLETSGLLIREEHFTDSIAIELHQTMEKAFKAIFAFYGIIIPRTHSLPLLYNFVKEKLTFPGLDIVDLVTISDYYETDRYPGPRYVIPPRKEVEDLFPLVKACLSDIEKHIKQVI